MSTPTSKTPPPITEYISEKWDPIIATGLTTGAVATAVGGVIGTLITRRGSGWRAGAMMAGVGFGIGNSLEMAFDAVEKGLEKK
ncbi:hypothetical protein TrRE_jg10550 [Triparma retinervis]|jgi:hypothetical protein|uniref:Uncharacterized protein n=1 Tax=Triparma retinervis TaxID=2557542 RepID=A0A9W7A5P6_9STRA|nr:hypothetical protein TrRE_jg10550 [Triparma retinervis]